MRANHALHHPTPTSHAQAHPEHAREWRRARRFWGFALWVDVVGLVGATTRTMVMNQLSNHENGCFLGDIPYHDNNCLISWGKALGMITHASKNTLRDHPYPTVWAGLLQYWWFVTVNEHIWREFQLFSDWFIHFMINRSNPLFELMILEQCDRWWPLKSSTWVNQLVSVHPDITTAPITTVQATGLGPWICKVWGWTSMCWKTKNRNGCTMMIGDLSLSSKVLPSRSLVPSGSVAIFHMSTIG